MCRNERQRVSRRNKESGPQNEVSITIPVAGGPEIRRVLTVHLADQLRSVNKVRIRMVPGKVFARNAVNHRSAARTQPFFKYMPGIWSGDGTHGVELQTKAAAK